MKAVFTLIPAEGRRLIAKGVVAMKEVKIANEKAYLIVNGGTTNGYVAQELLAAKEPRPERFTAGTSTHRLLCVTDADKRSPFPLIFHKGVKSNKTLAEALRDFHVETVLIKGANAVDSEGNVAVISSGFDGGTIAATLGVAVSQGLKYIVPVGLEKAVPSVKAACACTGAKTFDYSMGAEFGMFLIPNAKVVTELEALRILADVDATHVASGGIGESAGSVVIVVEGPEEKVRKAISIVESVKGEPALPGFKGTCETCRYACTFAGKRLGELPGWLRD
ncbi:MAG: hypothetical protein C4576_23570 [Desulfobacteraceae bacterium]|nr:MAG: hypothetical protein C4576_23570 [Desulfobacteraceae bacterium]